SAPRVRTASSSGWPRVRRPGRAARSLRARGRGSRPADRPCSRRGCRATSPRTRAPGRACASRARRSLVRPRARAPRPGSARGSEASVRSPLTQLTLYVILRRKLTAYGGGAMMKALVRHRYGGSDVVRVEEVERPALEDDQVLVRVRASSINK